MRKLSISSVVIGAISVSTAGYAGVPACISSNANITQSYCDAHNTDATKYRACNLRVRAKEYALRSWYSEAIEKAQLARFLDYGNTDSLPQLQCYYQSFADSLSGKSLSQAHDKYPELNLSTLADQINAQNSLTSSANQIQQANGTVATALLSAVSSSDWDTRVPAGQAAFNSVSYTQLGQLSKFLQFNLNDISSFVSLQASDPSITLGCSVFYPLQFAFSQQAITPLLGALRALPNCSAEIYRAVLVQAFTSGGTPGTGTSSPAVQPILQDSSYAPILYRDQDKTRLTDNQQRSPETLTSDLPTLDSPAAVMLAEVTDPKLTRAIVDSQYAEETVKGRSDITQDELNTLISNLDCFISNLGANPDQQLTFYKQLTSYASGKSDLINLKMGAAFAYRLASSNSATCSRLR